MQTDWNQIYKLTAQRTGKSEDIYKEIGNFVFKDLAKNIKRPKKLIIKLKGIGSWYLRKTRVQQTVELFPPDFDKKPKEGDFILKVLHYENKVEIYNLFKERLKDYDKYLEMKAEIRKIRNQTQKLLEPKTYED